MITFECKIQPLHPNFKMPVKATEYAACYDVFAVSMKHNPATNVFTYFLGFALEPPINYRVDLRSRSSISEAGLILCNGIGTGDPDFRGEYRLKFYDLDHDNPHRNTSPYSIGDRVGQIHFEKIQQVELVLAEELSDTVRGEGGFGSTGNT